MTYGSKDPITKTLQKFAIDLTAQSHARHRSSTRFAASASNSTLPIRSPARSWGSKPRSGKSAPDHETIDVEMLNVLTDDGLRSVPLDQVGTIKPAQRTARQGISPGAAVLALGHDADKKSVTLHFPGKGKRPVRVGYIQKHADLENQLPAGAKDDDGKPMLQGWAIVENTTEEDWNDVRSDAGQRPADLVHHESLRSALRQRPMVEPELFAGAAAAGLWPGPGGGRPEADVRAGRQPATAPSAAAAGQGRSATDAIGADRRHVADASSGRGGATADA